MTPPNPPPQRPSCGGGLNSYASATAAGPSGSPGVLHLTHGFVERAEQDGGTQILRARDLVGPQDERWVVERFAETVDVVREDTESVRLRAHMLAPVERRLGLLLVVAGPEAFVFAPPNLRDAGIDLARDLLAHHQT